MKTILIADDEELIRRSLGRLLSKEGFKVIDAKDGDEAEQAWLEQRPDIILLDYLMPRQTGLEVLSKIPEKRRGIVIVISAFVGEQEMLEFQALGVNNFYKKPFEDIFKFLEFVKQYE
jgi:CheY-like chemotaxis protein